jgi:hypothetical protein
MVERLCMRGQRKEVLVSFYIPIFQKNIIIPFLTIITAIAAKKRLEILERIVDHAVR